MTCEWQDGACGYLLTPVACPRYKTNTHPVTTHSGDRLVDALICPPLRGSAMSSTATVTERWRHCDDAG